MRNMRVTMKYFTDALFLFDKGMGSNQITLVFMGGGYC